MFLSQPGVGQFYQSSWQFYVIPVVIFALSVYGIPLVQNSATIFYFRSSELSESALNSAELLRIPKREV
jgi:hypothetical protein